MRHSAIPLSASGSPSWFLKPFGNAKDEQQPLIAALEALAQLVLLHCRCVPTPELCRLGWMSRRLSCDKFGVVGACAKGMSLKEPLASVLQAAGLYGAPAD